MLDPKSVIAELDTAISGAEKFLSMIESKLEVPESVTQAAGAVAEAGAQVKGELDEAGAELQGQLQDLTAELPDVDIDKLIGELEAEVMGAAKEAMDQVKDVVESAEKAAQKAVRDAVKSVSKALDLKSMKKRLGLSGKQSKEMVAKLKQLKELAVKGLKIREEIHTQSLVASFEAKVDMDGASAEAKAAYEEGGFKADGKANVHSKGEAGAEIAAQYQADGLKVKGQGSASVADGADASIDASYEDKGAHHSIAAKGNADTGGAAGAAIEAGFQADGLKVKGQGSASVADGADASIDAGYEDKGKHHSIAAKGHADTDGKLSTSVKAQYEQDEWKLESGVAASTDKGLAAEVKATYQDATEKAEAIARYGSQTGADGELEVESKSEHVTVSGKSKIDDDGNIDAETRIKVKPSDDVQFESVMRTGSGGSSFGGSVLFGAGTNATIGASATAHSLDGLSAKAQVAIKGDGVEVEGAISHSEKTGAKGEIDLTYKPNDQFEIGAHVEGSEIGGLKAGGHMKVKPSKDVEFLLKGEGDSDGNVTGTAGVKFNW